MQLDIYTIAEKIHGKILVNTVGEDHFTYAPSFTVIDSRKAVQGSIFFCIKGAKTNGHQHISQAVLNGAKLIVVEEDIEEYLPHTSYIKVDNTTHALGLLAHYIRSLYPNIVIAITGSAGKTTTKEILSHVLSSKGIVAKNPLNHNNQIGMPLAMLHAPQNAIAWVLEVGISQEHDMHELGTILHPNIIYITNAGNAHTEGLGEKGVAYHKASLLNYIQEKSALFLQSIIAPKAFIPKAYPELCTEAQKYSVPLTVFSSTKNRIYVEYTGIIPSTHNKETQGSFSISYQGHTKYLALPYIGYFMEDTLCGIIELCLYLGISFEDICTALENVPSVQQRNTVLHHNAMYIIDDTYNANPVSMKAMVDTAFSYPAQQYIFLLGDMKELGSMAQKEHLSLGAYIATTTSSIASSLPTVAVSVLWKGEYAPCVYEGLQKEGFTGNWIHNPTSKDISSIACSTIPTVLVCKGSRSIALEKELKEIYTILGVTNSDI